MVRGKSSRITDRLEQSITTFFEFGFAVVMHAALNPSNVRMPTRRQVDHKFLLTRSLLFMKSAKILQQVLSQPSNVQTNFGNRKTCVWRITKSVWNHAWQVCNHAVISSQETRNTRPFDMKSRTNAPMIQKDKTPICWGVETIFIFWQTQKDTNTFHTFLFFLFLQSGTFQGKSNTNSVSIFGARRKIWSACITQFSQMKTNGLATPSARVCEFALPLFLHLVNSIVATTPTTQILRCTCNRCPFWEMQNQSRISAWPGLKLDGVCEMLTWRNSFFW